MLPLDFEHLKDRNLFHVLMNPQDSSQGLVDPISACWIIHIINTTQI